MAMTLIRENQNSISPYTLTLKKLVVHTQTRPMAIQTPVSAKTCQQFRVKYVFQLDLPLLIVVFQ